jgi:opacity protein-like surface antigen
MRISHRTLAQLTLGVAFAVLPVAAMAADMPSRAPVISDDSMVPQEIGTGWYLRGDIGVSQNQKPGDYGYGSADFTGTKTDNSFVGSIGFGYQFNDMFRADATLEWMPSYDVKGATTCATWTTSDCTGDPTLATGERTKLNSFLLMANGYVDLASWNGLTPYVGAGLGVANLQVGAHESVTLGAASAARSFGEKDNWSLAASAMVGASYSFGNGLMLDVGYRYLWIDGGETKGESSGAEGGKIKVGDLSSHQIRAGLRYYLY